MAQFGLKDVANVYLIKIDGKISSVVVTENSGDLPTVQITVGTDTLTIDKGVWPTSNVPSAFEKKAYFDTLKTSSIEVTAEETKATGGRGNADLLTWSYGKSATMNMTDALITPEALSLIYGATTDSAGVTTISPDKYSDAYAVVGFTMVRDKDGRSDKGFVFFAPQAQFKAGGTLSMSADGDPTTIDMSATFLRDKVGGVDQLFSLYIPAAAETN